MIKRVIEISEKATWLKIEQDQLVLALNEGEDVADDSLVLHAAHLMATAAIIIDARACGKLRDDRVNGDAAGFARTQQEILARRAAWQDQLPG